MTFKSNCWWWLFPHLQGFWENVRPFTPRLRFLLLLGFFVVFFLVEINSRTLIPLFRPRSVHNGLASWDDCGRLFPDKLRVSSFPDRFPHSAWIAASSDHFGLWVKGVCVFSCSLPHALFAKWPGSFTCHCGNTGVQRTQHIKLTLEKKLLSPLLPGFELATFRSRVRCSYQQAILAPHHHAATTIHLQSC